MKLWETTRFGEYPSRGSRRALSAPWSSVIETPSCTDFARIDVDAGATDGIRIEPGAAEGIRADAGAALGTRVDTGEAGGGGAGAGAATGVTAGGGGAGADTDCGGADGIVDDGGGRTLAGLAPGFGRGTTNFAPGRGITLGVSTRRLGFGAAATAASDFGLVRPVGVGTLRPVGSFGEAGMS